MTLPASPTPETRAALEVRGISKSFVAGRPVLRDVDLCIEPGRVVALLGPSGCGKTTLLRTIAGLETPDAGRVLVGDEVLTDGRKVTPPESRRLGMVFQDWALFPHLTVARNVGYGLPRGERTGPRVAEALDLVGLDDVADRLPGTLSGGQQQRVALARALAPRPRVLLFDEPFSNLDSTRRAAVRTEVRLLLRDVGITSLFVTHDQEEAFILGDEVAVMHEGRIEQQAPPAALYDAPATRFVAGFVGDANFLRSDATNGVATSPIGRLPLRDGATAGAVDVLVRPEHFRLDPGRGAVVHAVEPHGHDTVVHVDVVDGPRVLVRVPGISDLHPGDEVAVDFDAHPRVAFPIAIPPEGQDR